MSTTLSVRYIVNLLEAAKRRGLSPEELCIAAGFEPPTSDDPDLRYPTSQYLTLWRVVMDRVADPAFPLDVVFVSDPARSDVLGFAFVTSSTLGAALDRISRHLIIMTDGARWQLETSRGEARLALVRCAPFDPDQRFADEFALGHIVHWTRKLTGVDWVPNAVRFRHPAPAEHELRPFREELRSPLAFGCERSEICLDARLLDLPMPKADSAIAAFFDRHIEALIERRYPGKTFAGSLRTAIIDALSRGNCSLEVVAKQLSMSPRTARRRLAAEGVTFNELLAETRAQLAAEYLRDRRLSIGEISFVLGYAEPAAFHRAFRRWTGLTPASYRRQQQSTRPLRMPPASTPQSVGNVKP